MSALTLRNVSDASFEAVLTELESMADGWGHDTSNVSREDTETLRLVIDAARRERTRTEET